jgi:biopolymer transport protein TolQ
LADRFEEVFWSGNSLEELYERVAPRASHPMALLFVAAMREWMRANGRSTRDVGLSGGLRERIDKIMSVTLSREMAGLERYLDFLATVGSTAPFIGLFGTVWGIMNSFQAIAQSHNTSLAVVAPGIAEALFATALGLFAAIPAVIAYNRFNNQVGRYGDRLEGFSEEFSAVLSRRIEEEMD